MGEADQSRVRLVRRERPPGSSPCDRRKSRGTQLSVVGIRIVHLCWGCDADAIERWQKNRPNPLLPKELPTFNKEE